MPIVNQMEFEPKGLLIFFYLVDCLSVIIMVILVHEIMNSLTLIVSDSHLKFHYFIIIYSLVSGGYLFT